jgi:hypothetical protein
MIVLLIRTAIIMKRNQHLKKNYKLKRMISLLTSYFQIMTLKVLKKKNKKEKSSFKKKWCKNFLNTILSIKRNINDKIHTKCC